MLKNTLILSGLIASVSMVGCASVNPSTERNLNQLQNKNWVLSQLGGTAYKADPNQSSVPQITFNNLQMSGTDGCNSFNGGYAVKGQKIKFSSISSTAKACLNATDLPEKFKVALNDVQSYKASDDKLEFLNQDRKVIMIFENKTN